MENTKKYRLLELFFRALRGEDLSVKELANEYEVSTKSISRSIADLKAFLSNYRELLGQAELCYSYKDKCYRLHMDEFLSSKELFALVEVMIGARAFSRESLLRITAKLKQFTTPEDRKVLRELIHKELYHYPEIRHDCESVEDRLWQLIRSIREKKEITIEYYRMDRALFEYRLKPLSVLFSEFYFYLIAHSPEDPQKIRYFRIDRIKEIRAHRKISAASDSDFDEGLLRKRSLFMWPGKLRTVRFEFSGPSVQAALDRMPTAKIIERLGEGRYLMEAETYGDGIKMWLLSQGAWVKVVAPADFAEEMKEELKETLALYQIEEEKTDVQ